jgi:deoxyribonuclease-4
MSSLLVGPTMSLEHGVSNALVIMQRHYGARALQLLLGAPDASAIDTIDLADAEHAQQIIHSYGFYVVIHGKYRYNFCRPASTPGWSWQFASLERELQEAAKIGADVVIHQGKNLAELGQTREAAHQTYADNIAAVLCRPAVKTLKNRLLLENSSRQGTECGWNLEDLADIYGRIPQELHERIGFCIDLCHAFVAGVADFRNEEDTARFFRRFEELIGADRLKLVHFNDSSTPYDGHNDHHACLECGYIAGRALGGDPAGMRYVARYCAAHAIPMILETGGPYALEVRRVVEDYAGYRMLREGGQVKYML